MVSCAIAFLAVALPPSAPVARIGLGSCAHQNYPQPIWRHVLRQKPDTFVFLGDNIYSSRPDEANKPLQYAKLAALPDFQRLMRTSRVLATWDDHDYGVNDGGAEYPEKRQAQKEFCDFWKVPSDSPRRTRDGVYDAVTLGPPGKRVQFILLDTRFNRSPIRREDNPDGSFKTYVPVSEGTMLGEAQWRWLEQVLTEPAELRILASSIQVVPEDHRFEKWANLPHERQRLFDTIKKTGAEGVLIVSGDRHLGELSLIDAGLGYPLFDFTASSLNRARLEFRYHEPNRHRVSSMNVGENFGMILIDWSKSDPAIQLQLRDLQGEVVSNQRLKLSDLRRKQ